MCVSEKSHYYEKHQNKCPSTFCRRQQCAKREAQTSLSFKETTILYALLTFKRLNKRVIMALIHSPESKCTQNATNERKWNKKGGHADSQGGGSRWLWWGGGDITHNQTYERNLKKKLKKLMGEGVQTIKV